MTVRSYEVYSKAGGDLTEKQYNVHLEKVKSEFGKLIDDIGIRIFRHLDLQDGIAFTQVKKKLYQNSKRRWFVTNAREIVLKYIQQKTSYKDYLKNGGWQDFVVKGAEAVGAAVTIYSGVKAAQHASCIPPDAPTKTVHYTLHTEDGRPITYTSTIIDHPEARLAERWGFLAGSVGTITAIGIICDANHVLTQINLDIFFSTTEEDLFGSTTTNIAAKIISPDFHEWKIIQMKNNLASNPSNWQQIDQLKTMVCPISKDFMLFPVKDQCGHYFDYRSIRAYQLNPATANPLECPISAKPNTGLTSIRFDKARFDRIQSFMHK